MTNRQEQLVKLAEKNKEMTLKAERWLWAHPQVGYTEWEAHNYLKEAFEALGYTLTEAGNIPGFYTDLDTGKPGPKVCVMGELDALDIANHPESVNGMTHSCGHHAQGAGLLGLAAALKEEGALQGLCGTIRLMMVPAEEMIQLTFREELRKKGIIRYMGGKVEFMARGFLDGVDISMMIHASNDKTADITCTRNMNGCVSKTMRFKGKSSHAGGSPEHGINAQYAATNALTACNALRETFPDKDMVRFHPILLGVNSAVNIIPDEMKVESYVRANSLQALKRENRKINRALAGSALAMGAGVELTDRPGYAPEKDNEDLMHLAEGLAAELVGKDRVRFDYTGCSGGSSDFGDVTYVMPGIQMNVGGAAGTAHGIDYYVEDAEKLCMNTVKMHLFLLDALLTGDAAEAKRVMAAFEPQYPSIQAYLEELDGFILDKDAVVYHEDGSVTVDFSN